MRLFKSPNKDFVEGHFKKAKRPTSPSPARMDYRRKSQTKADNKSKCTFIDPKSGKRCSNLLGLYPQYCQLHTMLISNVYIAKSNITKAGNGLFAGPHGFKKGQVIGKYSMPWNKVSMAALDKRCKNSKNCYDYVFCDEPRKDPSKTQCWDGYDIRSTVVRNINDAHNSKFKNNSYFTVSKNNVYVIASRNIKPYSEIFVTYGDSYWE